MVRLESLNKTYRSRDRLVHVINEVTQAIPEGVFFTLLGPSGCGKTTTLRVIAGLEQHDSGSLWFGDQLIACPERRIFTPTSERDIGMVFQSYAIWPHMDVYDNVAYPLTTGRRRVDSAELRRRVTEAVELVGLGTLIRSPATALSGGQQQRVALARALVAKPRVLLLDEPLSNLDALLRERMRSELVQLQRQIGVTAVYVTHDRAEALSMSDLVAVMNNGRIEMTGPPREVYRQPATEFVAQFLGHCNRVSATVVRRDSATQGIAQTPFGGVQIEMAAVPAPGTEVFLMIRPEDLVPLLETVGSDVFCVRGPVSGAMYFGEHQEADVSSHGQRLRVRVQGTSLVDGTQIALRLREPACWAFASS